MPATLTATHLESLSPTLIAGLPDVSLLLALYASEYVHERRPDLAKVAAFVVDGVNRWGLPELVHNTCHLVAFWQQCADDTATSETWAAHYERFDNRRIIHCTLTDRQFRTVRRHLTALAAEAVAA
ncbi:hypothetical protein [Streptomyces carpinensis]|uniref:Uncharacterized protein n=1 Tax=Streptomyces carpinensis TaxID=66369 RepID=A0ABV1WEW0_9ACTN|nr:hypothetical protein [Streptomyces carpinensis]